jgi:hypothetical protein
VGGSGGIVGVVGTARKIVLHFLICIEYLHACVKVDSPNLYILRYSVH